VPAVPWLWTLSHRSNIFQAPKWVSRKMWVKQCHKPSHKSSSIGSIGNMFIYVFFPKWVAYDSFTHMIHKYTYMIWYDIHRLMTIPQMNSIWSHVEAVDWIQRWVGVSFGITWFEFQTCFNLFQFMCIFPGKWWNFTDLTTTYKNRLMRSCSIQGHAKSLPPCLPLFLMLLPPIGTDSSMRGPW
jgi:hypothetical protein